MELLCPRPCAWAICLCVQLSSLLKDITCTQSPLLPAAVTPESSTAPGREHTRTNVKQKMTKDQT